MRSFCGARACNTAVRSAGKPSDAWSPVTRQLDMLDTVVPQGMDSAAEQDVQVRMLTLEATDESSLLPGEPVLSSTLRGTTCRLSPDTVPTITG